MIAKTTQALIEKTLPINPPTAPQIIAYITHKMVEIMRHHLYFFESKNIARGNNNNNPKAIQECKKSPPTIEHMPI